MSSPRQVAAGFTITGLLDGASRTRGRYPVSEIAVADIADHPANAAYSMDPAGIAELAESIREDGLTDLPLVRKVGNGSWQMVSGHRRKAAYALLAKDDPAYERMPCRVIEGIDDERAVTLLHAANYFTRALTVTERAAATEALRGDAVRLRSEDPSLSGMRVDDVKAAIIERQTGRKVSGKTIAREERLARRIAEDLSPEWAAEADRGNLSAEAVRSLAGMPKERQAEMHAAMEPWRRTKRELSDYVRSESNGIGWNLAFFLSEAMAPYREKALEFLAWYCEKHIRAEDRSRLIELFKVSGLPEYARLLAGPSSMILDSNLDNRLLNVLEAKGMCGTVKDDVNSEGKRMVYGKGYGVKDAANEA